MDELITFINDRICLYEKTLDKIIKNQQDNSNNNSYNRTLNNYILIDEITAVLAELESIRRFAEKIKNAKKT